MSETLLTFGEVMGRFEPSNPKLRFPQAIPGTLTCTFAGAESNVASDYCLLGGKAKYVTALPEGPLTNAFMKQMRGIGVDVSDVQISKEGRMGLFFLEPGSNQRPSKVTYDRTGSSISIMGPNDYDWDRILKDVSRLHISGITPAISENAANTSLAIVKEAYDRGIKISIDLNFRKKLWNWKPGKDARTLARETMANIVKYADIIIGNEEDAYDVMGIKAGDSDASSGNLDINRYPEVASKIGEKYPYVQYVAFTLRESISADHNNWGAMLWSKAGNTVSFAPLQNGQYKPYRITDIVDRVGGGDSFAAALLFAMQDKSIKESQDNIIAFAVAASCLCHTIEGDINFTSKDEAVSLMKGNSTGRVSR